MKRSLLRSVGSASAVLFTFTLAACGGSSSAELSADNPAGIMPITPLGDLKDLHVSENSLLRKLLRQATREKEIGLVPGGSKDDALRMTRSADGEFIRQDVPGAIQKMRLGGPDQATLMFSLQLKD